MFETFRLLGAEHETELSRSAMRAPARRPRQEATACRRPHAAVRLVTLLALLLQHRPR
ncbi:MAG TPA: hypothetical protein VJ689_06015 [Gaiellaceae bacterium]|jgi:hypothetical protein|nr:hypothetical protein [Gaiellaceae bacterium]